MKKIMIIASAILITGLLIISAVKPRLIKGRCFSKVTVRVVDEQGIPIEDADVYIGFKISGGWSKHKSKIFRGKSNSKGEFSAVFNGLRTVGGSVVKAGYYRSFFDYKQKERGLIMWKPWNPKVEITLRKKLNPIPLYAKCYSQYDIPANNEKIGYDFFVGDWCEPYGKGKINDIYISYAYEVSGISDFKWSLQISTISSNDGFICIEPIKGSNSVFKLPYLAPAETNYLPKYIQNITVAKGKRHYTEPVPLSNNVFFRTRSKIDNKGNVTNCFYGKITNIESALARDHGIISFTYYLNPTPNDRNLEFNTKSNLFQNLDRSERVSRP